MTDPIQVLRQAVDTFSIGPDGRGFPNHPEAVAALAQMEALVDAALGVAILWAHPDASVQRNEELFQRGKAFNDALAPFKENAKTEKEGIT